MKARKKYEGLVIILARCDITRGQMWTLDDFQGVRVYRRNEYDGRLRPLGPLPFFDDFATAAAHVWKKPGPVQLDLNEFLESCPGKQPLSFYCDVPTSNRKPKTAQAR